LEFELSSPSVDIAQQVPLPILARGHGQGGDGELDLSGGIWRDQLGDGDVVARVDDPAFGERIRGPPCLWIDGKVIYDGLEVGQEGL
jgi:hypothetical protein